jgi:hypothetical protein
LFGSTHAPGVGDLSQKTQEAERNSKEGDKRKNMVLHQTKQILPRSKLCLPPHRHHVLDMYLNKYKRQREIVKRMIRRNNMVHLKFPLKQNQEMEVKDLKNIKQIPSITMLYLHPHRHQ